MTKKKRRQAFQDWEEALAQEAPQQARPQPLQTGSAEPGPMETLPHDIHLLERARTQWQFGQWQALSTLDPESIHHHPDRAKLALLAATAHAQRGQTGQARALTRQAIDWGVDRELITRFLLSGMHNSLARAAALAGQDKRARRHFEDALNVGIPGGGAPMAVRARAETELTQIGLDQTLPRLIPAAPQQDAPTYLKRAASEPSQELMVFLPDRSQRLITLYPDHPEYLSHQGDRILFDVPDEASLSFSSNPEGPCSQVPRRDLFGLAPATEYRVTGHLSCSNRSASACLIEYDQSEPISDHTDRAIDNRFDLQFRTSRRHRRLCIAFRIRGRGALDLGISVLRIQQHAGTADSRTDPSGV